MDQLVIEGDPKLLAGFEAHLREELTALGVADQVTIESELVALTLAPGELGFGQEIRRVLVGIAKVLTAGEAAIRVLAKGIADRLARDSLTCRLNAKGEVHVVVAKKGDLTADDIAATGKQIADAIIATRERSMPH